ncbi:metalloregulator ArsR/SmtB family transcription factor [Reinekea thalattae]|uniref:Metalloregulator ArsR/SmtB family transcription factor n=1 Tax=Reinekea thalattae TaxID=2593301 RepID=A0A5C8Z9Z1_9GAMM|nr:metalloregulator ArsR/SmtB family transcription factor [Reinekea thalattae]TXR54772.1 metalloregulator ArsR/SmtB family transcription factor [Reinekea thalattae]
MNLAQLPTFFKAIGDPIRISILQVLGTGAYGVLELSDMLEVKQSGMSHHLKILSQAGWVEKRREGNTIFYRRTLGDALEVQQRLFRELDVQPLPANVKAQQQRISEERLQSAKQFFIDHADQFELHQERIVLFEHYGPEALQLLDSLNQTGHSNVLEVGPGQGEFLAALAKRFDQVTGLDISPAMLSIAAEQTQQYSNVTLVEGSTELLNQQQHQYDIIFYNMVLHHVPMPEEEIAQCAKLLKPEGLLIITDLCQHEQEWAREQCGDQWLGFEPNELHLWAKRHQFSHSQSNFLALRNGFQVQTQVYRAAANEH